MENPFDFSTRETAERMGATQDYEYTMSKTSLIYRTHRKTGETVMFLMTIVPDWSYLERTKFDPFKKMSYLRRDNKFDGLVFFHGLNGEFVNGWMYRDGDIIATMDMHDDAPEFDVLSTRMIELECWELELITTYEWCYYANGRLMGCVPRSHTNHIMICFFDGGIGSAGGFDIGEISGNGGAPTTGTPDSETPYADRLFDVDNLTEEERKALENMITEMLEDCMGANLYSALVNNGRLAIQFNNINESWFCPVTRTVSMHTKDESWIFFHEIFHAFQRQEATPAEWTGSTLNREIEAWFAMYLYIREFDSYPSSGGSVWKEDWGENFYKRHIASLSRYIDPKTGKLMAGVEERSLENHILTQALPALRQGVPAYADRSFNFDRTGDDNFRNLQKLMEDC